VGTMSKSKRNGVDPQGLIEAYGADTARFFIIFTSPPEQTLEWNDAGVEGAHRFLRRLWAFAFAARARIAMAAAADADRGGIEVAQVHSAARDTRRDVHAILKQANYDLGKQQFNTVASAAMKMLNALEKLPADKAGNAAAADLDAQGSVLRESLSILLRLLAPITPHISHALWRELGFAGEVVDATWPEADEAALARDEIDLVLQVNGKLRGNIRVAKDADRAAIERIALEDPGARRFIADQPVKKVVIVPGRLVNVVV
jgi:leucyl-tRNA synthetase